MELQGAVEVLVVLRGLVHEQLHVCVARDAVAQHEPLHYKPTLPYAVSSEPGRRHVLLCRLRLVRRVHARGQGETAEDARRSVVPLHQLVLILVEILGREVAARKLQCSSAV